MWKNSLIILVMLVYGQGAMAQQQERTILDGQLVADSIAPANVKIVNKSLGKHVISDANGFFSIPARDRDTLVFSSQTFDASQLVLTEADFKFEVLRIKLIVFVNALDEVVISADALTGDLSKDEKNIKVFEMPKINVSMALQTMNENDTQSTPDNIAMPGYVDTRFMMDFEKLGNKLLKLIRGKKAEEKVTFMTDKIFPEAVREKFSEAFFLDTLKLKHDEIGLFLTFCEDQPGSRALLDPRREFELVEFLIAKRSEFNDFKNKD